MYFQGGNNVPMTLQQRCMTLQNQNSSSPQISQQVSSTGGLDEGQIPGMSRSATAPSTPVALNGMPGFGPMMFPRGSQRPNNGNAPSGGQSMGPPVDMWQVVNVPQVSGSPSAGGRRRESSQRGRKPGRARSKTPILTSKQPNEPNAEENDDKTAETQESESKSEPGVSPGNTGQGTTRPQSSLGMPSALDEITSGLDSGMAPEFGSSSGFMGANPSGSTDDFSAMFGVSDIFDFDFDQEAGAHAGGRASPGISAPAD